MFKNYFTEVPSYIVDSSRRVPGDDFHYSLTGNYPNSFYLQYISASDVISTLQNLKTTKGAGYLRVPDKVVEATLSMIAEPLSLIFDRCIH